MSSIPVEIVWLRVRVLFVAFLVHMTMVFHAGLYFYDFLRMDADYVWRIWVGLAFLCYPDATIRLHSLAIRTPKDYFRYIDNKCMQLHSYEQRYGWSAQAGSLWYGLSGLGFVCFAASAALFWWVWPSPWVLSAGAVAWCLAIKGRTILGQRFCKHQIDHHFVNRRLFQMLFMYVALPHLTRLLLPQVGGIILSSVIFAFVACLYSLTIIPRWIHLYFGQRVPLPGESLSFFSFLHGDSIHYGSEVPDDRFEGSLLQHTKWAFLKLLWVMPVVSITVLLLGWLLMGGQWL